MKYLILLFLIVIFASCKNETGGKNTKADAANAVTDTANYTQIQWLDSVQNIGTLTYGQNPSINFRFKNIGNKPLFIVSAQPGCGCTVADYPKEPIMPGEEGAIKAGYDTKNQQIGSFNKSITVITNTTANVNHILVFTGEIVKDPNEKGGGETIQTVASDTTH